MNRLPQNAARVFAGTNGFTLIELICSLAIAAVLALTLYSSLNIAFKAKKSAHSAVDHARTASVVLDTIARDLESALPPTGVLAGAFTGTHTGGSTAGADSDTVAFYCVGEDAAPASQTSVFDEGVRLVSLRLESGTLYRQVQRNLLGTVTETPPDEVLCRNVSSFSIRYYDGTNWLESWDSAGLDNLLPFAVRVEIGLQTATNSTMSANAITPASSTASRVILLSNAAPAATGGT